MADRTVIEFESVSIQRDPSSSNGKPRWGIVAAVVVVALAVAVGIALMWDSGDPATETIASTPSTEAGPNSVVIAGSDGAPTEVLGTVVEAGGLVGRDIGITVVFAAGMVADLNPDTDGLTVVSVAHTDDPFRLSSSNGWALLSLATQSITVPFDGKPIIVNSRRGTPAEWTAPFEGGEASYQYDPETGYVYRRLSGSLSPGTLETTPVGPMDDRVVVDTGEGVFVISDGSATEVSTDELVAANDRFVVTYSASEGTIRWFDTSTGEEQETMHVGAAEIADPGSLSPDGSMLAFVDRIRTRVRFISLERAEVVFETPETVVQQVEWDQSGRYATWVGQGFDIFVADVDTRELHELSVSGSIEGAESPEDSPFRPVAAVVYQRDG